MNQIINQLSKLLAFLLNNRFDILNSRRINEIVRILNYPIQDSVNYVAFNPILMFKHKFFAFQHFVQITYVGNTNMLIKKNIIQQSHSTRMLLGIVYNIYVKTIILSFNGQFITISMSDFIF